MCARPRLHLVTCVDTDQGLEAASTPPRRARHQHRVLEPGHLGCDGAAAAPGPAAALDRCHTLAVSRLGCRANTGA